ncbi:LamG domain-containing protein, partial [bacterium]|nr:LamG domain-containing protein [bacterium]
SFLDNPEMQLWGTAFNIEDKRKHAVMQLADKKAHFGAGNFTIEAIVYHRKMFPDANVRVIASEWDGSKATRGWNLGVTSEKSAYRPRNLIVQLIGNDESGMLKYEVVASNLRIPSNKPYYVAAAVDFKRGEVTFYSRDMSYDESELETVVIKHSITGGLGEAPVRFTVGGRDHPSRPSNWDGLIDEVRLSKGALMEEEELLVSNPKNLVTSKTLALWRFNRANESGIGVGNTDAAHELVLVSKSGNTTGRFEKAFADFCHVILNSNEFLYLD